MRHDFRTYGGYYSDSPCVPTRQTNVVSSRPTIQTADFQLRDRIKKIVDFFRGPMAGDSVTQTLEHPVEGKFRVTIEFLGETKGGDE